jgi:hypothetical protein
VRRPLACMSFIPLVASLACPALSQSRYLKPDDFPTLPASVRQAITSQGCEIPQSSDEAIPHNIIRGQFARTGQFDWAVVCSGKKLSTILVLWGGQARCSKKVWGPFQDEEVSRGIDQGLDAVSHHYFIRIRTLPAASLMKRGLTHLAVHPSHDTLEFIWPKSGSSVQYCSGGKWVKLSYAD